MREIALCSEGGVRVILGFARHLFYSLSSFFLYSIFIDSLSPLSLPAHYILIIVSASYRNICRFVSVSVNSFVCQEAGGVVQQRRLEKEPSCLCKYRTSSGAGKGGRYVSYYLSLSHHI